MKKTASIVIICIISMFILQKASLALINLDKDSILIAIKYGLDNRFSTYKDFLGPNWIDGKNGIIISVYSPFIQLAAKARNQSTPGTSDEDILFARKKVSRSLNDIQTRNEVRFLVQLMGDKENFCTKYSAYLEEYLEVALAGSDKPTSAAADNASLKQEEKPSTENEKAGKDALKDKKSKGKGFWIFKNLSHGKKARKLMPKNTIYQNEAELDNYDPLHPYSGTNSYNFDYLEVAKFDKFYLVVKGPDEKEMRFLIEKNVIF